MASGRTISAHSLTDLDGKAISLCEDISSAISESISGRAQRNSFARTYGKIHQSRDSGTGLGGGKLQRDALCTRGRTGKAPFSNRNLRWHPLVVAESKPRFAKEIERIEIEGSDETQTLIFVVADENRRETRYPADMAFKMPERFAALPKHWFPHIEALRHWSDTLWTQNSCVIPALEACDWQDSVETYAILGMCIAAEFYGADFGALHSKVMDILRNQQVDRASTLPTDKFPRDLNDILQCPLCRRNVSNGLQDFRSSSRATTWQPGWRSSKKTEGDDSSIQIMHVEPLVESEIKHHARNVRYGHRWCNVAMTDHSLDETLDFMEFVVRAHNRGA